MIKISVPSRFELELLEQLAPIQERTGHIHEVYGSLTRSGIGSGRPARRVAQQGGEPTFSEISRFTQRAHALGIRVNYLLNAAMMGLREYSSDGRRQIDEYLLQINETGVDMVTVAIPYLIEVVRRVLPEMPVSCSVVTEVASPQGVRGVERLGASRVQLSEECNRDLPLLDALTKSAKAELSLIVNNGCLRQCAYRHYHNALCTQASQEQSRSRDHIDYPLLKCSSVRALEPVEILRSPWIRPEDLTFYEQRFGVESFKIAGRQLPLEQIVKIAAAYADGSYEGNFMDLLATPSVDFTRHPMTAGIAQERGPEHYARPEIFIDNAQLGKLTKALHSREGCPALRDCEVCRLCDEMLPRVMVSEDTSGRIAHGEALAGLIDDLAEGRWTSDERAPVHSNNHSAAAAPGVGPLH